VYLLCQIWFSLWKDS